MDLPDAPRTRTITVSDLRSLIEAVGYLKEEMLHKQFRDIDTDWAAIQFDLLRETLEEVLG